MNTLPTDLLCLLVPKLDACESILLLITTNNNIFNVDMQMSLKEIIKTEECRLVRYHMKRERAAKLMVKYTVAYKQAYSKHHIFYILMTYYIRKHIDSGFKYKLPKLDLVVVKGAIISNNLNVFEKYAKQLSNNAEDVSEILRTAIKYGRIEMINRCLEFQQ